MVVIDYEYQNLLQFAIEMNVDKWSKLQHFKAVYERDLPTYDFVFSRFDNRKNVAETLGQFILYSPNRKDVNHTEPSFIYYDSFTYSPDSLFSKQELVEKPEHMMFRVGKYPDD